VVTVPSAVIENLALDFPVALFGSRLYAMVDAGWLLGQLAFAFTFYKVSPAVFHVSVIETPSEFFFFG
jgi:hypothetical protein